MLQQFVIPFTFFAALHILASANEKITYEGLRLDFSALTINRDIFTCVKPAMNRTVYHQFLTLHENGPLGTSLHLRNIKIKKGIINEDRFNMYKLNFTYPIYNFDGDFEAMYFDMSFEYDMSWLGFSLASGTGAACVTNIENDILVLFNETNPDVKIPPPWDVMNVTIPWHIISPATWIESLLEEKFLPEFDKALDDAMFDFSDKLLKTYQYVEDVFPNDVDLVFRNAIYEVKSTAEKNYLSMGFTTNITVNKRSIKKIYRKEFKEVYPRTNFDYCLSAQMIPDTIDLLGKAGYYTEEIDWRTWGFLTNQVSELYVLLPSLRTRTRPEDTFEIRCETSQYDTVNDLGNRKNTAPIHYLYPYYCYIRVENIDTPVLMTDVFLKIYYEMKTKQGNDALYGQVLAAELGGFRTFPELPESKNEILRGMLYNFCSYFNDKELASPGILILPNRQNELIKVDRTLIDGEACVYYDEKIP